MTRAATALGVTAFVGLMAGTGALVAQAWGRFSFRDCLPSNDVADYLNRGLDIHEATQRGEGALRVLFQPDVHPPGLPATLALAAGAGANTLEQLSAWMFAIWIAALALMLPWGWQAARGRGLLVAGLAMLVTAASLEQQRLAPALMTENLAFLSLMTLLWAGGRMGGWRRSLGLGVLLLLASWVRYSAAPMLGVPLSVHGLWERRREPWRAQLRHQALLWGPTALVAVLWQLLFPDFGQALERFFRNVDSGLPFWSAENLLWVPGALAEHIWVQPALVVILGLLAGVGVVAAWWPRAEEAAWRAPARLVQLALVVALIAYTLHPYKLPRALHALAPMLSLCAGAGVLTLLERGRMARLGAWTVASLGGLAVVAWTPAANAEAAVRPECITVDATSEALQEVVSAVKDAPIVYVAGGSQVVSGHVARLWLRWSWPGKDIRVVLPPPPECATETQLPPPERCVDRELQESIQARRGALVVLATNKSGRGSRKPRREGGGAGREHWSVRNAEVLLWLAERGGWRVAGEWPLGNDQRSRVLVLEPAPGARAE